LGSQLPRTKTSQPVFNRRRSLAGGFIPGGRASGDRLQLYGTNAARIFNRERYKSGEDKRTGYPKGALQGNGRIRYGRGKLVGPGQSKRV